MSGRDWDEFRYWVECGLTIPQLCQRFGWHPRTVQKVLRRFGYRLALGRRGGQARPVMPEQFTDPDRVVPASGGHGRRLTEQERVVIQLRREDGWSMARIAQAIGVSAATVCRELKRGQRLPDGRYCAALSHSQAVARRARPKPTKLSDPKTRAAVIQGLNDRFSPRQVAAKLRTDFAEDHTRWVSHETIYQALYVQGKGALRQELKVAKALRSGRTHRIAASKLPKRSSRSWLEGHHISTRPAEAADRAVPGHWEGDLVIGKDHKSALITLVERSSRFTLLHRLINGQDSTTVVDALIEMTNGMSDGLLKSLTWDQGSEMADHLRFTLASNAKVYFCDPHSPWQRGTNENTNYLVRDLLGGKQADFRDFTDADIAEAQRLLNIRPRQILNWQTPANYLAERFLALTT